MARRGLGKGLDALFQSYDNDHQDENDNLDKQIEEVKIHEIDPNVDQPRKKFDEDSIKELSKSILEHGVVQPIIVKPLHGRYTIVAGERRWRAARNAGLEKIPVIIRDLDEKQILEIALVENLQREDLNPIEEAMGISTLISNYDLTQGEVAQRLGKSRSAITNSLRLLNLPEKVREYLAGGLITSGHARALLGLNDKEEILKLADQIIKNNINVRETENLIKKMKEDKIPKKKKTSQSKPAFLIEIEEKMEETLGTRVTIQPGKKKSTIEIEYYNNDDLERIIRMLSV